MTDQNRFENAESVRDLYRDEGAERERQRIIEMLMNEPVSAEVYKVIEKLKEKVND
jgi:hypothetical protein